MEKLLHPPEAADLLGISLKGLHALCRSNKLGYVRINGKERRFTHEHLEAFIAARSVQAQTPVDRSRLKPLLSRPKSSKEGGEKQRGKDEDLRASLRKEIRELCQ